MISTLRIKWDNKMKYRSLKGLILCTTFLNTAKIKNFTNLLAKKFMKLEFAGEKKSDFSFSFRMKYIFMLSLM